MKYWVYQESQVRGPFDRAQIRDIKGFAEDTLVCPEGRKGTDMGDWQRAGTLPELATLFGRSQIATTIRGLEESTLGDTVSELKKKFARLENTVEQIENKERLLEDREARARIAELESRLSNLVSPDVSSLEKLEAEVRNLRERLAAVERGGREMPPLSIPVMPAMDVPPVITPEPEAKELTVEAIPSLSRPPEDVVDFALPKTPSPFGEESRGLEKPPPPLGGMPESTESLGFGGPIELGTAERSSMTDITETQGEIGRWSGKQKFTFFILAVIFSLGMAAIIYFSGRTGEPYRSENAQAPEEKAPAPAKANMPQTPMPAQETLPPVDLSQTAVDLVKEYKIPGSELLLGQRLEKAYPQNGGLSPWMVEKLGDEKYQVNFYYGTRPLYVFLVQPKSQIVQGVNSAAVALLNGAPLKIERMGPSKKRRHRVAHRNVSKASDSGDTIITPNSDTGTKGKGKGDSKMTLDQILGIDPNSSKSSQ